MLSPPGACAAFSRCCSWAPESALSTSWLGPKRLQTSFVEHQQFVGLGQRRRTVSNQNHAGALGFHVRDGAGQRGFADGVEVGVRFIQHHQARLAVQGARQCHRCFCPPDKPLPSSPSTVS